MQYMVCNTGCGGLYFAENLQCFWSLFNHYQFKYVANRFVVNCAIATPVLHSNDVPYMVQGSFALHYMY